jgi:hypothetical protein
MEAVFSIEYENNLNTYVDRYLRFY